jgi:hypothetical protein
MPTENAGETRLVLEIKRGPNAGPQECGTCKWYSEGTGEAFCWFDVFAPKDDTPLRLVGKQMRCRACLAAQAAYDALAEASAHADILRRALLSIATRGYYSAPVSDDYPLREWCCHAPSAAGDVDPEVLFAILREEAPS